MSGATPARNAKLAALAAALAAMGAAAGSPASHKYRPPRRFTDARKAAAQAKRDRRNAKRMANHHRQQGRRS